MINDSLRVGEAGVGAIFIALVGAAAVLYFLLTLYRRAKGANFVSKPDSRRAYGAAPEMVQVGSIAQIEKQARESDGGSLETEEGGELLAVIAAAIAALEEVSISDLRIASIRKARESGGFNTPVWGRIERLTRK